MIGKGKKSNFKSRLIYLSFGTLLLAILIGGLVVWYVFLPAFIDLILCLGAIFSSLILYFIICRGVFLSKNSGYEITEDFLIYKDGFPNSKKYVAKLNQITNCKIKPNKCRFLITAGVVFFNILVLAIVLAVLLSLEFIITFLIILGGLLVGGFFVGVHFLSKGLGSCIIEISDKTFKMKNMPLEILFSISQKIKEKGDSNEV